MNEAPAAGTTLCYSMQALGHTVNPGMIINLRGAQPNFVEDIKDVVYVSREGFDASKTKLIAEQIGKVTQSLHKAKRPYILIGPGRWGTVTHNLGIPVTWQQIWYAVYLLLFIINFRFSGAACIVETKLGSGTNVPSQGTHFFQNITSFDIPYFTVTDGMLFITKVRFL